MCRGFVLRRPESEPIRSADAPSLSGEAFPAVMVPSGRKEGLRAASFSGVVSERMPSSRASTISGTLVTMSS